MITPRVQQKIIAYLGISTLSTWLLGVCFSLFIGQGFEDLSSVTVAGYNIAGWSSSRLLVAFYIVVGILYASFSIALMMFVTNAQPISIGKVFLLIGSFIWMSFGIAKTQTDSEDSAQFLLIRLFLFLISAMLGMLLIGVSMQEITKSKTLKFITLGALMVVFTLVIIGLIQNEDMGFYLNIGVLISFAWIGVFAVFLKLFRQ